MASEDLRLELDENFALRQRLQLYTEALLTMLSQNSACSRIHRSEQRLALWLLLCHDRVGVPRFPMTQEFMAQMVGVRRATVTEAAQSLSSAGTISYQRGLVDVTDRDALERACCECYRIIRNEYDRLLGETAW